MSRLTRHPNPGRAFTLVEVLAAMLLIAIVLPAAMKGISLATVAASDAKRRTEAVGLAQAKLGELLATGSYQSGNQSGDFPAQWPGYRWESTLSDYTAGDSITLSQLDVRVRFPRRGGDDTITLSTLVRSGS